MSLIAACDPSTHALALVLIDEDSGAIVRAETVELVGDDLVGRIRSIRPRFLPAVLLDDVLAFAIERPIGRFGSAQVSMAFGAVLACLPPSLLVLDFTPPAWKVAVGLKGNASKAEIRARALELGAPHDWGQDLMDALLIAGATLALMERRAVA